MSAVATIRSYRRDDQAQVLELLRAALGETPYLQRTSELFTWKHIDNPFGSSIMLVAEDVDGLVGFRAFMRWELVTPAGETVRCVRPVDTATHPRARRQGIFRRLTMTALDRANEDGVDLVFNTPNPRSGAGYRSMGWTEVGSIGVMVRPCSPLNWRRSERSATVTGARRWDEPEIEDRPAAGLRTPRSPAYTAWRFGSHPAAPYWLAGDSTGTVLLRPNLRRERRELVVSDMFGPRAGSAVRRAARSTDAAYLVGWFGPAAPERAAATRAGLLPIPGVKALRLYARQLREIGIEFDRLQNWDISMSDLELL